MTDKLIVHVSDGPYETLRQGLGGWHDLDPGQKEELAIAYGWAWEAAAKRVGDRYGVEVRALATDDEAHAHVHSSQNRLRAQTDREEEILLQWERDLRQEMHDEVAVHIDPVTKAWTVN